MLVLISSAKQGSKPIRGVNVAGGTLITSRVPDPSLMLEPCTVTVGTQVTVKGTDFPRKSTLESEYAKLPLLYVTTDAKSVL
jgi:hypothetical protein